jgi:hypothetical protein
MPPEHRSAESTGQKMTLPDHVQSLIDEALIGIRADPQHHFSLTRRLALYKAFVSPDQKPPSPNRFRGQLGVLTAKYVIPIWNQVLPIWKNIPPELTDDNDLPQRLIWLAEGVLQGTMEIEAAWKEACDQWDAVGNIGDSFSAHQDNKPIPIYFACDAALKALHESLNKEFLGGRRGWEKYTDDNLPDVGRDAASSAVVAYAGNRETEEVDLNKRREFWEWWLLEAVPPAGKKSGI